MLRGTEDNYVNCFEPRFEPRTSVISIGRVTICTYKRITLKRKLLKFVVYFYLSNYLSVVQWPTITSFQSPYLPVYCIVVQKKNSRKCWRQLFRGFENFEENDCIDGSSFSRL